MLRLAAVLVAILLSTTALGAEPLVGRAQVVSGDTLVVDGTRLRLFGIDAPEAAQSCDYPDGMREMCGRGAALTMMALVEGDLLRCEIAAQPALERGLRLATCFRGEMDVAAEMIRRGLAWVVGHYETPYRALEAEARTAGRNIWRGPTETPWDHRARLGQAASRAAPGGCPVKALLGGKGERLYHAPWSPWYADAAVAEAEEGGWFCDEAEAIEAGWHEPLFLTSSIVSGVYEYEH